MTPKMQKYQNTTGKRETFSPYAMRYPQWNYLPDRPSVRVLIDETGNLLEYERKP